jgi:hypothetical protein
LGTRGLLIVAFEGEYTDFQQESKPSSAITTWDTNPLFTFFAQIASGFILLVEWGIALVFLPFILQFVPPTGPPNPVGMVVMVLFVPVGILQLYLGYRLYKRIPNTTRLSLISALWVIIMSVTLVITGYATGTLSDISLPAVQIGANVVLAYLATLRDVKEHFDGAASNQYL